ncbi:hypothetical protein [Olivibacter sitiensis]|uniref:hypothetical protein n=1 Tax=Olivibacter sitiensis TaxID=376470 RepID=UPI0012F7F816|nr:hypothetical protein [Olivibacter sitiensis]
MNANKVTTKYALTFKNELSDADRAAVLKECEGMVMLTHLERNYNTTFSLKLEEQDSTWLLSIAPELLAVHRNTLQQLLDTLLAHPAPLPETSETVLQITETDPDLLKTLDLRMDTTFILQPLPESAYWTYKHTEIPGYGGLKQSHVTTYLSYKLAKPIPAMQYTMGLPPKKQGEVESPIQEVAVSMFNMLGPIPIDYKIKTGKAAVDSLWETLKTEQTMTIDSTLLTLRWTTVDFNLKTFSPILDADTLIKSSIEKLPHVSPSLYHLLLAPKLSRNLTSYKLIGN